MNFGINLIFLIKPSFYMNKKSRQKFKYLENEKIFHHLTISKAFIEAIKINFFES